MIGYLDKAIRPLVLELVKNSGYVKAVKVKDGDKDKNNKLASFRYKSCYKNMKPIGLILKTKKKLIWMHYRSKMIDIEKPK